MKIRQLGLFSYDCVLNDDARAILKGGLARGYAKAPNKTRARAHSGGREDEREGGRKGFVRKKSSKLPPKGQGPILVPRHTMVFPSGAKAHCKGRAGALI